METEKPEKKATLNAKHRAFLAALKSSLGIVSTAAEKVGINRKTHYEWLQKNAAYKQAVEELEDVALDFAESKLFELMNGVKEKRRGKDGTAAEVVYVRAPDTAAVIFYCKTKGKKRGYIERRELTGEDGGPLDVGMRPIVVNMAPSKKTGEE